MKEKLNSLAYLWKHLTRLKVTVYLYIQGEIVLNDFNGNDFNPPQWNEYID